MEDGIIDKLIECLPFNKSYGESYNNLIKAFKDCDIDVLKSFIKLGISPNTSLYDGHSALTLLIGTSTSDRWQETATMLLENGANPNQCNPKGATVLSLLVATGEPELVSLALKMGADVEGTGTNGESALITAVHYRKVQCLNILLDHGANPNVTSKGGNTAIMWAASRINGIGSQKSLAAVKSLIAKGADPSLCNDRGYTPLMNAALIRETATVQILIDAGVPLEATDYLGETALFKAVYSNCVETVKQLLVAGTNVNAKCKNGRTPLMVGNSYKIFNKLLEYRSDESACDSDGLTALHYYAKENKGHFVRMLCTPGSKINSRCNMGNTALQLAVRSKSSECIQLLLDRGANFSISNNDGIGLFHETIVPWDYFRTIDIFPQLNSPSQLQEIQTYLSSSCETCIKLIRELLAKGGSCDSRSRCGVTPLMLAALCGDLALSELLVCEGAADPCAEDEENRSVLSYACRGGNIDVVRLLLRRNITVNCFDSALNLPMFYAAQFQFMDIVHLLMLDFAFHMCYSVHKKSKFISR